MKELDKLLQEREECRQRILPELALKAVRDEASKKQFLERVGDAPKRLAEIDEQIGTFMSRYHYWITRLFSKTIKREYGEVSVVEQKAEVVAPKNEKRAATTLYRKYGTRYVIVELTLNRTAILSPSVPKTHRDVMRRLGVRVVKFLSIRVKSPSEEKAKSIYKRPLRKLF